MTTSLDPPAQILVDSHVHLYSCFDPEVFLNAAARNFREAAKTMGLSPQPLGYLLFTEVQGLPTFDQLIRESFKDSNSSWRLETTGEPHSLISLHRDGFQLILVKGRQIVTRESIEILALATPEEIPDNQPTVETLEQSQRLAGMTVIPWGFGKWLASRGSLVDRLVSEYPVGSFYLGDTSSRARFLPRPKHFAVAEARGFQILQGTDPLPFPYEVEKPGSCGFMLEATIDLEKPADSLVSNMRARSDEMQSYTRVDSLIPFARNQLAMQIRKRLSWGSS